MVGLNFVEGGVGRPLDHSLRSRQRPPLPESSFIWDPPESSGLCPGVLAVLVGYRHGVSSRLFYASLHLSVKVGRTSQGHGMKKEGQHRILFLLHRPVTGCCLNFYCEKDSTSIFLVKLLLFFPSRIFYTHEMTRLTPWKTASGIRTPHILEKLGLLVLFVKEFVRFNSSIACLWRILMTTGFVTE